MSLIKNQLQWPRFVFAVDGSEDSLGPSPEIHLDRQEKVANRAWKGGIIASTKQNKKCCWCFLRVQRFSSCLGPASVVGVHNGSDAAYRCHDDGSHYGLLRCLVGGIYLIVVSALLAMSLVNKIIWRIQGANDFTA